MYKKILIILLVTTLSAVSLLGSIPIAEATTGSLTITHGNNQTIIVNSIAPEPLVVLAGAPVTGVSVSFYILEFPSGATGQTVTPATYITSANGLAATQFKAGNIPGIYRVYAVSANIVIFTINVTSGLTTPSVTVSPNITNTRAQYKINFNVSPTGALSVGGRITVEFPTGTTVPTTIAAAQVRVNGVTTTTTPTISGRVVNIFTPVAITNSGAVELIFLEGAGIINPATPTNYRLSVSTIVDSYPVESGIYAIVAGLTPATVVVTPATTGSIAHYRATFNVSPTGALSVGGRITVEFPTGTTVPTIIAAAQVRVNGVTTTTTPTISGRVVNIFTPVAIANSGAVELIFLEGAGITNPTTAGDYRLKVSTIVDTTATDSYIYALTVPILPTTIVSTVPSVPDGTGGWYRTFPTITLTSTSPGGAVTIFYRWGATGTFTTYTIPFRALEGENVLHYYGRDTAGNTEITKTLTFKVDTILPVITITNFPTEGVVNTPSLILEGTVEVGSTLLLNNLNVVVLPDGRFITTITLNLTGPTVLVWVAIDRAGNTSTLTQTITLDRDPPLIELITPRKGITVRTPELEISGKTEIGAKLTINDKVVSVGTDGVFRTILFLNQGVNTIIIVAQDKAKNSTTDTFTINYIPTTTITTQVGNKYALVNNKTVVLDVAPILKDGRVLVPFRFLAETFGAEVVWDSVFKIIIVTLENKRIILQVDKNYASVNGVLYKLDVGPMIVDGRTLVPIRFIAEQFNSLVTYDSATKIVTIINPKP